MTKYTIINGEKVPVIQCDSQITITNKKNGILVQNEDSQELSGAIMELINDKKKCLEYGLSGYNLVQKECNSKSMVEKTLRMYNQIINK